MTGRLLEEQLVESEALEVGFIMDEQNLPIDIQLKKLLDWLFSRRICNRQWHETIIGVRMTYARRLYVKDN